MITFIYSTITNSFDCTRISLVQSNNQYVFFNNFINLNFYYDALNYKVASCVLDLHALGNMFLDVRVGVEKYMLSMIP